MRAATALVLLLAAATHAHGGEDLDKARAYFQAGVEAYDAGKYEVALREFQHAHALSHNAALYFNMAACEEHMDHFQAAALLLRQYLIEKPDADDRANVELRIKSLEERDERLHQMSEAPPVKPAPTVTTAPPATVAPPTVPSEPPRRKLKYTWVLLGVTGAVGVAAIGVGSYTVVHHGQLASGCGATASGCSSSQIDGLKATAAASDALIAVAAAAAVATVVVAVVESRRARAHAQAPARLAFGSDGVRF